MMTLSNQLAKLLPFTLYLFGRCWKTGIDGGGLFRVTPGAATLSSVASLDVLTVDGAKKMLTAVDGALVRIDLERSDLGAVMSRMEHTINNLSNIVVNTKAARSEFKMLTSLKKQPR